MKKLVFMGTPDFSVPILESLIESEYEVVLVVTQPDRPVGRKRVLTPPAVKKAALKHDLAVFQPERLKDSYEEVIKYQPDLIVTAAYGQLLPNELLDYPEYGSINVHASLLPKLRGGAPIHYSIIEGHEETGITIMYMVEQLDAGNIISQEAVKIEDTDTVGSLHDKLSALGRDLLLKTLPQIFEGTNKSIKQDEEQATYAPNISRELERIDWSKSNQEVFNLIRGLNPWPVAYAVFEGERMKILCAEYDREVYTGKKTGEIVKIEADGFSVCCGNEQAVKVIEIQPAGKKKMKVEQFLHGADELIKKGMIME